jgi:hypothetical protein
MAVERPYYYELRPYLSALAGVPLTDTAIRSADRGDVTGIIELMTGAMPWPGFPHEGSKMDFWQWRYGRNPRGFTNEVIADCGGRVCAHAASLPTDLIIGGAVHRGAQCSDLLTREDMRNKGLMDRAVLMLRQLNKSRGIEVEFAFPSAAGEKVLRKAGFVDLPVNMGHYELIADPDRFFRDVRYGGLKKMAYRGLRTLKGDRARRDPDVEVYESVVFPDDIERMVLRFEKAFTFVLRRDVEYLRWRYSDPRGGKFRILFARRGPSTAGLIVLRPYSVEGRTYMDIVDLVAEVGDEGAIGALVSSAARVCREIGSTIMQMWLPSDHPYLPDLGRAGFLHRQTGSEERTMKLLFRPLDDSEEIMSSLKGGLQCHLVLGDTDWV